MPEGFSSDDGGRWRVEAPDRHGQAALLLIESLIHSLIARAALTVEEAIETIEVAADAEREIRDASGVLRDIDSPSMLTPIAASLRLETNP